MGEFLYWVGISMLVCYIPRLFYFCKLCGLQCLGGKVADKLEDRQGMVWALNGLLASQILTVVSCIVVTIFLGVTVNNDKLKDVGEIANTTQDNKWLRVSQVLGNQGFGILMTLWWRYDYTKWYQTKKDIENGGESEAD